ncbi:MAG: NAD-binding protein, partial [Planctomycetaceae bacterium]|nr:NAD-binding protein [Planctomycetaceae bacterium]
MSTIVLASLLFFKLCRPSNAEANEIMRVLLFGCGYLGQRLATRLTNEGHQVFAVTRNPSRADDWKKLGWETVVANVVDTESLQALPDVDVCVYAVG